MDRTEMLGHFQTRAATRWRSDKHRDNHKAIP